MGHHSQHIPALIHDSGDIAQRAVRICFGRHISGLLAWLIWAFIHLMYIVQFRSRLTVFIEWAIEDLTFNRGARLITGSAATDFDFNKEMASGDHRREAA